jgi:CDP-6-deoxy-D-xylo-4-hexulose-3-dehydrase
MSSFSFYFGHQLSTIEGGMVNTNDKQLYEMLLMLRSHGWAKDLSDESYDILMKRYKVDRFHSPFTFFVPGYNLRATDLQAFLGIRQIEKANWAAEQRNKNHLLYAEKLKGYVNFQHWEEGDKPVSISFGATAKNKLQRKYIVRKLVENEIETRIFSAGNLGVHPFWTDQYPAFTTCDVSNNIHQCGFFIPNYPELTEDDIEFICNVVKSGQEEYNQRQK